MQYNPKMKKNEEVERMRFTLEKKSLVTIFFIVALLFSFIVPSLTCGAQKKQKKPLKPKVPPVQKEIVVTDANILVHQKRVEDLVEKGDFENAVKIMQKMNDYAKEVLSVAQTIKAQYETVAIGSQVSQNDKEDLYIKLRGLNRLIPRYTNYYEASTFNLGYMYAKLGEKEKARKYLVEFLQITPYSDDPNSQWPKAKALLLELYKLEGEF